MSETADQRGIADWFDETYARKGKRYLRPVRAYRIFPELLGVGRTDRLLDVACGAGLLLEAAASHTPRLDGCDISKVAVGQARARMPGARVVVANAETLPYPDGVFDVVTCLGSLERMLDRRRALGEMARVGAPGARYCFMVRNSNTSRWRYLSSAAARRPAHGHADADTMENWSRLFGSSGLSVLGVLPDQYPLLRRQFWRRLRLGASHFRTVTASRAPLERANEFVFLLGKDPP